MLIPRLVLLVILAVTALAFTAFWWLTISRRKQWGRPSIFQLAVGFITDFFDTLGIGSFALTTAFYRLRKTIPDELLPGTLNVGHTLPTIAQALVFIAVVKVDPLTLWLLIGAAVVGAWWGAELVVQLPRRAVQLGMGTALLVAAVFLLLQLFERMPSDGSAIGLTGIKLIVAIALNCLFGALMTIGVGAYAPIMVMVSVMGMNAETAFPIMMGSCAFLMPAASLQFVRNDRYDVRSALGLTLLGVPGVFCAVGIVRYLGQTDEYGRSMNGLKWLVVVVVIYSALSMLWAARRPTARSE